MERSHIWHAFEERVMHGCRQAPWLLAVAVVLLSPIPGAAQVPGPSAAKRTSSADEEAVRKAADAYREAVEKGHLDAITAFWADDADFVDQAGHAFQFKDLLANAKRSPPADGKITPPALKTETLSIRLVSPDVAIEDGEFERTERGASRSPHGRYSTVWVKRDGKWLIDGVRESPVRAVSIADHLEPLAWTIGEWEAEGPGATAQCTCTWGPDKTYILRQIHIQTAGAKPVAATQWIGWDPINQRIHSFVFDSRGGYSEGIWTNEEDAWVVTSTGVMPNGKKSSATNIYTRVDDNTAMWESINDELEGPQGADIRLRATRKQTTK